MVKVDLWVAHLLKLFKRLNLLQVRYHKNIILKHLGSLNYLDTMEKCLVGKWIEWAGLIGRLKFLICLTNLETKE